METLRVAAEKGGSRPAVFHNLGFAYEQLGRLDEAEAAYGEAAGRARTDAKVYLGWGVVALKRSDYASAAARAARAPGRLGAGPPPAPGFGPPPPVRPAGRLQAAPQIWHAGDG